MLAVGMGVLAVAAPGCGPAGRGDEDLPLPVAPVVLTGNHMEIRWQTRALLAPGTHLTDVWVVGGFLVCHGSDHRVYVIDAKTGVRLWSKDLADPHETVWPPTAYKNDLWFATTTKLIGFHGADGRNIVAQAARGERETSRGKRQERRDAWHAKVIAGRMEQPDEPPEYKIARAAAESQIASVEAVEQSREPLAVDPVGIELAFAPSGRPATNGVHMYVPDGKGWLQAVSMVPGVVSWGRWTDDAVTAGPVADDALVYFAGRDGVVYASTQNVRRVVWQHQTEGAIVADLKRTEAGLILAASLDYSLYAFQGTSGRLDWRYNAGERIRRAPYAFGTQVFVFTQQAGLTALDENGKVLWRLAEGDDVVTADNETVYVLSRGNDLLAVDRKEGKVRWGAPLRTASLIGTNETNTGILYLATPEGQVLAAARKQEVGQGAGEDIAEAEAPEAPAP
ncbi:MAG TPA: PQQ-binding-like beta-propeller repeat protein [Phycisphaerae bacterium]|nr:PQQ-binding-like beta-propeller repeat protein [Phycisphaerae bacterium]